jgi:uncharacterized protein YdhG (YjbR/CyaY superfamily)
MPAEERDALQHLRTVIKQIVPQVEERISYGTTAMFSLVSACELLGQRSV